MTITVLQSQANAVGSSSDTAMTATAMLSSGTVGTLYVVSLSFETATVSGLVWTSARNGTMTQDFDSGALNGAGGGNGAGRIFFFSIPNTSALTDTFSGTWTTGSTCVMAMYELSGGATFLNAPAAITGAGSLTSLGYSITPLSGPSFVVCVGLQAFATGINPDAGYAYASSSIITFPKAQNNDNHMHEFNASASGVQSLNVGGTASGGASIAAAAYGISGAPPNSAPIAWIT